MVKKLGILFFIILSASWSAGAQIITSKKEAEKKGLYGYNNSNTTSGGPSVGAVPVEMADNSALAATTAPEKEKKKKKKVKKAEKEADNTKKADLKDWLEKISDEAAYDPFPYENYLAQQLVNNALEFEGVRYRTGGTTTAGMDCSGMVYATFRIFDIELPHNSAAQAQHGRRIKLEDVRKGDLLFFKNNRRRSSINHVGMVTEITEEGEIKFIHAALHGGVIISSMNEDYYKNTFEQANRIIED